MFAEEGMEFVRERYELAMERICELGDEEGVKEPYRDFVKEAAKMFALLAEVSEAEPKTLAQWQELNQALYADIRGEAYERSYANPAYAVEKLGEDLGRCVSFLMAEIRAGIVLVFEGRGEEWTSICELFLEIYQIFAEEAIGELDSKAVPEQVRQAIYYYVSDYSDITVDYRNREQLDPSLDFATRIVMDADLSTPEYLYYYGEYISDNELGIAAYLNTISEEEVKRIADTFTGGYIRGFANAGKDLSAKKTVNIRYPLGFERVVRQAIFNFREIGLEPILYRAAVQSVNKRQHLKIGYAGTSANPQYDYDHRFDDAIYLDAAFKERKLAVLRTTYEKRKDLAASYAGPAVLETFGEAPFEPVNKEQAPSLSEKQKKLSVEYRSEAGELTNQYIKGDETSFTIISFPVPEIGAEFENIFRDTMTINTLDYETYKAVQETLIGALDQAEQVHIVGKAPNRTDLWVALAPLKDPNKETKFENCLADVNIPLGEVFTSPKLTGTGGILHVSDIYINDLRYLDLELKFVDGMAYTKDPFVRENLFYNHESLPMGEFAIGTNTAAYAMAKRYGIMDRMKILIIEKMGPHFAVGDTCYSHEEDLPVYNPDGKEVVARDNEVSILRKSERTKAYFNCHTDVTIPYDELDTITVFTETGEEIPLIVNGRFVLPGTEILNEAMEQ